MNTIEPTPKQLADAEIKNAEAEKKVDPGTPKTFLTRAEFREGIREIFIKMHKKYPEYIQNPR